jgi:hypothetical protein
MIIFYLDGCCESSNYILAYGELWDGVEKPRESAI